MYNPLAGLQNLGWVWPCLQCGGCQTPAQPSGSTEIAFGVDWPPDETETSEAAASVDPSDSTTRDIDCSAVPSNAVGIIRLSIIWFQLTGDGIVNLYYDMVVLALRDENGDLHSDTNAYAGPSVGVGGTAFQVDEIKVQDADTIRIKLVNLNAENAIVFWRWVVSTVTAGNPIPPPAGGA